jgi:hypothetical protein
MRCSEPGHRVAVAIPASREPGRPPGKPVQARLAGRQPFRRRLPFSLHPLHEALGRSHTHRPPPLLERVQIPGDEPSRRLPLSLRPRPLGQRLGLARKPNPSLQFVFVHSLPPVPRPTDVNGNTREILVDGAVSSCQTALDETSSTNLWLWPSRFVPILLLDARMPNTEDERSDRA